MNTNNNIDTLSTQLKTMLLGFLDELVSQFPQVPDFILARLFIGAKISEKELVDIFLEHLLPLKEHIAQRNEAYFLQNSELDVGGIDSDKLNFLRQVWKSPGLDEEDRESIWAWLDEFINLAELIEAAHSGEMEQKPE